MSATASRAYQLADELQLAYLVVGDSIWANEAMVCADKERPDSQPCLLTGLVPGTG